MFIYCGYIFKVSAAPFHNWAPDVYQNTPTVVTMMLITIPKISIMTALFTLTKEFFFYKYEGGVYTTSSVNSVSSNRDRNRSSSDTTKKTSGI